MSDIDECLYSSLLTPASFMEMVICCFILFETHINMPIHIISCFLCVCVFLFIFQHVRKYII